MRLRCTIWMLAAGLMGTAVTDLAACGDKFLVSSRGTRFQRAGLARQPATVLLFASPSSRLATTLDALGVASALAKVGYTPTRVATAGELARVMREGRIDLVVADLADREAVIAQRSGSSPPAIVAVAYGVSGAALKQARRELDAVIRAPGRSGIVVNAIDDVLFERALRARATARGSN